MSFPEPGPVVWQFLKVFAPLYHVGLRQAYVNFVRSNGSHTPDLYSKLTALGPWTERQPVESPRPPFPHHPDPGMRWSGPDVLSFYVLLERIRRIFRVSTDFREGQWLFLRVEARSYGSDHWWPVSYVQIEPTTVSWNDVYRRCIHMDVHTGAITGIDTGVIADEFVGPLPDYALVDWKPAPDVTWIVYRRRFVHQRRKRCRELTKQEAIKYLDQDSLSIVLDYIQSPVK